MEMSDAEILAKALRVMRKKEPLERAVGRIVREQNGKYEDYLRIMDNVRERAYSRGISPVEAAKELAAQP